MNLQSPNDTFYLEIIKNIVRTQCSGQGMSEEQTERFLCEEPGPEPYICPRCGKALAYEKKLDDNGIFAYWIPVEPVCDDPVCARKAAEEQARAQEAEKAQKKERFIAEETHRSGIPALYRKCLIGTYTPTGRAQIEAVKKIRAYTDDFENMCESGIGLYISGPYGTGKTHLATAIGNQLIRLGTGGILFADSQEVLSDIRASYDTPGRTDDVIARYKLANVLILDDLGKEYATEWALSVLAEIIKNRVNNARPLIVTSNFGLSDLTDALCRRGGRDVASAIVSRLKGCCLPVEITGADHRSVTVQG